MDWKYLVSLPERGVRAAVSLVTGVTSLATKLLLPKAFKATSTYKVTFGLLQQFLIENVAEINSIPKEYEVKDKYVIRKMTGTVIEGIGLISLHFSPVWMLAILSDISQGSKQYIRRLEKELKDKKMLEEDENYDSVVDLLDGISASSASGVAAIDTPPINVEEFKSFVQEMSKQLKSNKDSTHKLFTDMEKIYMSMRSKGKENNISLNHLSGSMAYDLMKKVAKNGFDITSATANVSVDIIRDVIFESYRETLEELELEGRRQFLIKHMQPFMKQMKHHFDKDKATFSTKGFKYFKKDGNL